MSKIAEVLGLLAEGKVSCSTCGKSVVEGSSEERHMNDANGRKYYCKSCFAKKGDAKKNEADDMGGKDGTVSSLGVLPADTISGKDDSCTPYAKDQEKLNKKWQSTIQTEDKAMSEITKVMQLVKEEEELDGTNSDWHDEVGTMEGPETVGGDPELDAEFDGPRAYPADDMEYKNPSQTDTWVEADRAPAKFDDDGVSLDTNGALKTSEMAKVLKMVRTEK